MAGVATTNSAPPMSWGLGKLMMIESYAQGEGREQALECLQESTPRGRELLAQILDAFESPRSRAAEMAGESDAGTLEQLALLDMDAGVVEAERLLIKPLGSVDRQALHGAAMVYGDVVEMATKRSYSILRSHLYAIARATNETPMTLAAKILPRSAWRRPTLVGLAAAAVIIGAVVLFQNC